MFTYLINKPHPDRRRVAISLLTCRFKLDSRQNPHRMFDSPQVWQEKYFTPEKVAGCVWVAYVAPEHVYFYF